MNWAALGPALGTLAGAAVPIAAAGATGGLSLAALPALMPAIGTGAAIGGAAGTVGGQLAPKDMPPPPATQLPGQKPQMPTSAQMMPPDMMKGLMPGQGGFLKRPFIG